MSLEAKLTGFIEDLRNRRYPTLLVVQGQRYPVTQETLEAVAKVNRLKYMDYRHEILDVDDSPVTLGAYLRSELREWLRDEARKTGGLIVEKADDLISTWSEEERRAFFIDFLHLECGSKDRPNQCIPIVLISRFPSQIELPTEERGQGILYDPATDAEL